jgi:putative Holliday junction resolvase
VAFDYGTSAIGVAVGQTLTESARALPPLKAKDGVPNWQQVEQLLKEWQPDLLLVGLPLNMDGSPSELSRRAEKFARRLQGRFNHPFEMVDERLSSFEAKGQLIQQTGSRDFKQHNVDGIAAELILLSWYQRR